MEKNPLSPIRPFMSWHVQDWFFEGSPFPIWCTAIYSILFLSSNVIFLIGLVVKVIPLKKKEY